MYFCSMRWGHGLWNSGQIIKEGLARIWPNSSLVSNHPSWGRLLGTHDRYKRRVLAFVEPLPSQFPTCLYVLLHGALDLGHFKEESRYLDGLGIASSDEVSEAGAELLQAVAGHEAMRVYVKVREPGWEENSQNTLVQLG